MALSNGFRGRGTATPIRRGVVRVAGGLAVAVSVVVLAACGSDDGDSEGSASDSQASTGACTGITSPSPLEPFEPGEAGSQPDLPSRIALAQDNTREFAQSIKFGLEKASEETGLEFVSANADGDSAKNIQQIQQFMAQGVGALVINPIDAAAQAPLMEQAISEGIAVLSVVTPPATTQANADQYEVGKVLAEDAASYIESELGGEASVVILNQDSIEPVQPRFEAMRDVLGEVPGVEIVSDVEPDAQEKDAAFETMNTVLQKTPEVDVVLGSDAVVLGALAALEAANKATPRQYLGGVDGQPEALAAINAGGPYKASVALAPTMFAYAMGVSAGDWLEGKPIPKAIDIPPVLLNSPDAIATYESDMSDPATAYADPATRAKYVELLGSISYDTHCEDYLAYPWQP